VQSGAATVLLAVMLIAVVLLLGRLHARHVRDVGAGRRAVLGAAQGALLQPQLEQNGIDYPVLTGLHDQRRVSVSVIVDTVALRGLPTLWLSVTIYQSLRLHEPVDILLRPSSTDIVSPGARFRCEHAVPPDWPTHVRLATPTGVLPSMIDLSPALPLLHDRRTKDVLLAPGGARLITELARADLGHYRLFRRSKFAAHLSPDRLSAILAELAQITARLELNRTGRPGESGQER
jgi:hypothetical protein